VVGAAVAGIAVVSETGWVATGAVVFVPVTGAVAAGGVVTAAPVVGTGAVVEVAAGPPQATSAGTTSTSMSMKLETRRFVGSIMSS
jgi:hypothetical protein